MKKVAKILTTSVLILATAAALQCGSDPATVASIGNLLRDAGLSDGSPRSDGGLRWDGLQKLDAIRLDGPLAHADGNPGSVSKFEVSWKRTGESAPDRLSKRGAWISIDREVYIRDQGANAEGERVTKFSASFLDVKTFERITVEAELPPYFSKPANADIRNCPRISLRIYNAGENSTNLTSEWTYLKKGGGNAGINGDITLKSVGDEVSGWFQLDVTGVGMLMINFTALANAIPNAPLTEKR